ncbi:MAG TPA: hypothetical protein VMW27_06280 [Thermoanaerobaculia bacterium]|nr:hypothetical protein [Thermoanaerobaculia bacterium]
MQTQKVGGALLLTLALAMPAAAVDYFVESDDYKDGEEIVNVFLKEDDYRLMVEDIERNGEEFDWGWVKVAGAAPAPAAPAAEEEGKKGGLLKKMKRGGGGGGGSNPTHPKQLGFDLASYKTISIAEVKNFAGVIPKQLPGEVQEAFEQAAETLGLEVAKGKGDLQLEVAIVDVKRDSTYVYFANVQPFIELELRLKDTKTGEDLMLLRNQAHSDTPADAAMNYASTLVKFLR